MKKVRNLVDFVPDITRKEKIGYYISNIFLFIFAEYGIYEISKKISEKITTKVLKKMGIIDEDDQN